MKEYGKIAKSKMLKNKYINNSFYYYKKKLLSFLFSVSCVILCTVLVINLSKISKNELKPKIILVEGYAKNSQEEKALHELASKYSNVEFLIYNSSFKRTDLANLRILQSYRIPIHGYNTNIVYFKQVCIFVDEHGYVKYYDYGESYYDNNDNFLTPEKLETKINDYGWN